MTADSDLDPAGQVVMAAVIASDEPGCNVRAAITASPDLTRLTAVAMNELTKQLNEVCEERDGLEREVEALTRVVIYCFGTAQGHIMLPLDEDDRLKMWAIVRAADAADAALAHPEGAERG